MPEKKIYRCKKCNSPDVKITKKESIIRWFCNKCGVDGTEMLPNMHTTAQCNGAGRTVKINERIV